MGDLIKAVTDTISGIFTGIIEAFAGVGNLLFTFGETGALTGISSFGYFMALVIGVPAGVWLFTKLLGLIKSIRIGGSAR